MSVTLMSLLLAAFSSQVVDCQGVHRHDQQEICTDDKATETADRTDDVILLPYFLGNGETGVYFAWSRDGLKFEWLNDGKVVMPAPPWGDESLTRDSSIV